MVPNLLEEKSMLLLVDLMEDPPSRSRGGRGDRPPHAEYKDPAEHFHIEPAAVPPAHPIERRTERHSDRLTERLAERLVEQVTQPTILSVTPEGEGETLAVVLALPLSEEDRLDEGSAFNESERHKKAKRVKLRLLVEQYADLQESGPAVRPGAITPARVEELMRAGELCAAIRRGMSLLQYGDRSARRLAAGLMAKGTSRETAEAAAAYLVDKGYIREDDTARRFAEQDLRKGWGPRRIREDLRARGFTAEAVDEAMETLEEVDFSEACARVIRKKYGELPKDYADRRKMTASLMRLGYDSDHIREASRQVAEGE